MKMFRAFTLIELLCSCAIGFLLLTLCVALLLRLQNHQLRTQRMAQSAENTRFAHERFSRDFASRTPDSAVHTSEKSIRFTHVRPLRESSAHELSELTYYLEEITWEGAKSTCLLRHESPISPRQNDHAATELSPENDEPVLLHVATFSSTLQENALVLKINCFDQAPGSHPESQPRSDHTWKFPL